MLSDLVDPEDTSAEANEARAMFGRLEPLLGSQIDSLAELLPTIQMFWVAQGGTPYLPGASVVEAARTLAHAILDDREAA